VLILDTQGDLNLYKEIWQREEVHGLGSTGSCCNRVEPGASAKQLSDVDFNFWAGELINKGIYIDTALTRYAFIRLLQDLCHQARSSWLKVPTSRLML
jgi:hypothetical protein